ncbi:MAG: hypothetical protein AMXMBFR61_07440 [Fimbriimonadales bacterium]
MKRYITLLLASGFVASAFAQGTDCGFIKKWDQMDAIDTYGGASWLDYDTPSDAISADDFLCTDLQPIVAVKFAGWSYYGNIWIDNFVIKFWTDVPATPNDASHPGTLLKEIRVDNAPAQCQPGWWDNGDGTFMAIFRPDQYFFQEGTPTNPQVYWISIQGEMITDGYFDAFYWNFRQRGLNWNDDAAFASNYFGYAPWSNWGVDPTDTVALYEGPLPTGWRSLDMAFTLYTIPEPGTMAALGAGLAGLLAIRRRK